MQLQRIAANHGGPGLLSANFLNYRTHQLLLPGKQDASQVVLRPPCRHLIGVPWIPDLDLGFMEQLQVPARCHLAHVIHGGNGGNRIASQFNLYASCS